MAHEGHRHSGSLASKLSERRLLLALGITVAVAAAEVVGGIVGNSLALISDAGHMVTDVIALGLSLFAVRLTKRAPTPTRTFGYFRAEIMAALANGALLVLVSAYILYEAYQRIFEPADVQGGLMLAVAVVGLAANLGSMALLRGSSEKSLNVRGAFLHMLSDAISSVGVIVAGLVIIFTGWSIVDPIVSIAITGLILRGAVSLMRESMNVLLEATPKHLKVEEIVREVKAIPGAKDMHDVHVWTISSGMYALSAHVLTENRALAECSAVLERINEMLWDKYAIGHTTLQLECDACVEGTTCQLRRSEQ